MDLTQIQSITLYKYFFKFVCITGVYPYQFNPNKNNGQLSIIVNGWLSYWYKFTAIYLFVYTSIQYVLLLNSIWKRKELMMTIIQSAWVYGTSYGSTAMLHRVFAGESLRALQQEFIQIQQTYLENHPKYLGAWKHQLIIFAIAVFFWGWVGSTIGGCLFFFTFPAYPHHLFAYTLADNNEPIDRTSWICLLFGLYETFMMIPAWGSPFTTYVSHHAIHSGLAYALQANSYDAYIEALLELKRFKLESDDDVVEPVNGEDFLKTRLDTALELNRAIYRFYKKYNETCAEFHFVFMSFAMFLSWGCLYAILKFYDKLNPFVLLIFIVNTVSAIVYILCHSNQASLEVRVKAFLEAWKQGPGRLRSSSSTTTVTTSFSNSNKSQLQKYYQQQLRSHPPIYYAYAGICRMEPSTVLELLYHFTNHVTVFLRF